MYDDDATRPSTFHANQKLEKALAALMGLLNGVTANQTLGEEDLLFLDLWLDTNRQLQQDPDVFDLMDTISDVRQFGKVTQAELDEVASLCHDILNYRRLNRPKVEDEINELLGLLAGIVAGDQVQNTAVLELAHWLSLRPHLAHHWLVESISKPVMEAKNHLTDSTTLKSLFKRISGIHYELDGLVYGCSMGFEAEQITDIVGMRICFTGKFLTQDRKTLGLVAQAMGATVQPRVTQALDVLVVGELASSDWRYINFGRKVEQALRWKAQGKRIQLLGEAQWVSLADTFTLVIPEA